MFFDIDSLSNEYEIEVTNKNDLNKEGKSKRYSADD